MTGKVIVIFPGFQGFPDAVGTLRNVIDILHVATFYQTMFEEYAFTFNRNSN